ncbi:hypothetical protein TRAPUB_3545 [Trametes pubescens]|uniref:F-box domain-containing protein n=1 Tax=Trametes pubescens TaxID=154538 RepID=A0A1M2VDE3_TRAPU|nr:hypothetical protein TRAPUB_3545 [Trametes pubescens]
MSGITHYNCGMRQLPLEIIEEIVAEAWKATTSSQERQVIYSSFKAAHPALKEVINRVAVHFITLEWLGPARSTDLLIYGEVFDWIKRAHSIDVIRYEDQLKTVFKRFQRSHLCFDLTQLLTSSDRSERPPVRDSRPVLRLLMAAVRSIRVRLGDPEVIWRNKRDVQSFVLPALVNLPDLTHLHLDFLLERYGPCDGIAVEGPQPPPIVLPSLVFLRMRGYPTCILRPTKAHQPDCFAGSFARAFPKLRELQLDAPMFLKYLDVPPALESITICAPPSKPFCSIQNCNVGAGLRRWMEPKPGKEGRAIPMRLKKIVVRTGVEEPSGWRQAQRACERFGIRFVREVVYV